MTGLFGGVLGFPTWAAECGGVTAGGDGCASRSRDTCGRRKHGEHKSGVPADFPSGTWTVGDTECHLQSVIGEIFRIKAPQSSLLPLSLFWFLFFSQLDFCLFHHTPSSFLFYSTFLAQLQFIVSSSFLPHSSSPTFPQPFLFFPFCCLRPKTI